jgi:acid stress-induced BolA-like protein IbaG/YrbA
MDARVIAEQLHLAISNALPGSEVEVTIGSPGHYTLRVVSREFEGKPTLARQRLVYAAIRELMAGDAAPVHAIDRLTTHTPAS